MAVGLPDLAQHTPAAIQIQVRVAHTHLLTSFPQWSAQQDTMTSQPYDMCSHC